MAPSESPADVLAVLTERQRQQALAYLDIMLETNESLNLTAVRDRDEALRRHIGDSLALLPVLDRVAEGQEGQALSLIDIGSGAGLPGMVLAIARPHWQITLLDALRKRCDFMGAAAKQVGLGNVATLWSRAEDAGRDPAHRERYDVAAARAVADLRVLSELCLPLVKVGGTWIAAKGPDPHAEVRGAATAIGVLGGAPAEVVNVDSCSTEGEPKAPFTAVVVRKAEATPAKYPRRAGMPNKRPL